MARAFDGTGDKVVYTHDSALNVAAGDCAVVCWAWIASGHSSYMAIIDKAGRDLSIFFVASGSSNIYVGLGQTDNEVSTTVPGGIWPKDQWFHFGLSRSGTTAKIYCNGTEVSSSTMSGTTTTTNDLNIGVNSSGGGSDLNGRVAELALFGRPVVAAEMLSLAAAFSPRLINRTSGVLYAPLIGQSAEPDLWGGRSGTVTNATITAHPRVIYPRRKQVVVASAAAPASTIGFLRDNAGCGAMGGGPFARANAGLGAVA